MSQEIVKDVEKVWLTMREAMKYPCVSRDFIDTLRCEKGLRFYTVGHTVFMKKQDIDRLIEKHRTI